jgi:hypothetical protein
MTMSVITFPQSPVNGQEYVATNGVTYIWSGYWSSARASALGNSYFDCEGSDSAYVYNPETDLELDGGAA